MTFSLSEAPATIRPKSQWVAAATMPRGPNAKPSKVTEIELIIEVDTNNVEEQTEWLFPGAKTFCQSVAALEHHKGEDRVARTKLPEMNVVIAYDGEVVFEQSNCPVKKRVQLKVDRKGESKMIIKPRVKVNSKENAQLAGLIDADIRLSLEPTQTDMSESTTLVTDTDREVTDLGAGAPAAA